MSREVGRPSTRPASTKVAERRLSIWPRTTRATSTHMVRPTATKLTHTPLLSSASEMAMTSMMPGMLHTTVISPSSSESTQPPK